MGCKRLLEEATMVPGVRARGGGGQWALRWSVLAGDQLQIDSFTSCVCECVCDV
jgi:hypothetical protein